MIYMCVYVRGQKCTSKKKEERQNQKQKTKKNRATMRIKTVPRIFISRIHHECILLNAAYIIISFRKEYSIIIHTLYTHFFFLFFISLLFQHIQYSVLRLTVQRTGNWSNWFKLRHDVYACMRVCVSFVPINKNITTFYFGCFVIICIWQSALMDELSSDGRLPVAVVLDKVNKALMAYLCITVKL